MCCETPSGNVVAILDGVIARSNLSKDQTKSRKRRLLFSSAIKYIDTLAWKQEVLKSATYVAEQTWSLQNISSLERKAINELASEIPRLMKFIVFNISIPVLEVNCESWGSTIDKIVQKRHTAVDGDGAAVGSTDKRMFIYSNGAPPGHKSVGKLLKAVS
ncbi:hypothetical protein AVEN_177701-1 [Araneus ventricosus]|uniref:Uncharacterized protein n=1 Tax=Araneus ventricosus TaxID=182803 RepID=A0A4Y2QS70_ARAVE|nr:hypothetical protein AVEN_177701-1 [Araneus ventricosus]